jgi:hypothetical protein
MRGVLAENSENLGTEATLQLMVLYDPGTKFRTRILIE